MPEHQSISDLIKKAKAYLPLHEDRLQKAYEFAQRAHAGQTRMRGEPYITHPLGVAYLLTEYKADEESLIASLLHDVIEDSHHTAGEIEAQFGHNISKMVMSLTKLPRVHNITGHPLFEKFDYKIENIRRLFEIMEDDIRIIVIKLCDRLHNMSSIKTFRREKQMRIAQETLDIYVRIAERLSLGDIKEKLEELSYRILFPQMNKKLEEAHAHLSSAFLKKKSQIVERIQHSKNLKKADEIIYTSVIPFEALSKDPAKNPEISLEVKVVFSQEEDCYLGLREIHSLWKGLQGKLKDFITIPKSNGTMCLETSIMKKDGTLVKFLLMTKKMADFRRFGITLSCFKNKERLDLPWLANLRKIHQQTKHMSSEYLIALESDILKNSIIVSVDHDKTIFLPPKSTALDGAFYHYGHEAFRLEGITVNGKTSNLSQSIVESDNLHFTLCEEDRFSDEWIYHINSGYARAFIYERLRSLPHQKKLLIGAKLLQQELEQYGAGYLEEISSYRKEEAAQKLQVPDWNKVLESVAEGYLPPEAVIQVLHRKEFLEYSVKSYVIEMVRESQNLSSLTELASVFESSHLNANHISTKRYKDGYKDSFSVRCRFQDLRSFLTKVSPLYDEITFSEYSRFQGPLLVLAFVFLIISWTGHPFIIRFLLSEGIDQLMLASLEMIASGIFLLFMTQIRRMYLKKSFHPLPMNILFWLTTLLLILIFVLSNFSLQTIPPTQFVSIMCLALVISFYINRFLQHDKNTSFRIWHLAPLLLIITALVYITKINLQSPDILRGFIFVLMASMGLYFHNFFKRRFEEREKIKDRSLLNLSFMMLLGGLVLLPFTPFQNILSISPPLLLLIALNGIATNAIGNAIYLTLLNRLEPYKANTVILLILPLVVLLQWLLGPPFLPGALSLFAVVFVSLLLIFFFEKNRVSRSEQVMNSLI